MPMPPRKPAGEQGASSKPPLDLADKIAAEQDKWLQSLRSESQGREKLLERLHKEITIIKEDARIKSSNLRELKDVMNKREAKLQEEIGGQKRQIKEIEGQGEKREKDKKSLQSEINSFQEEVAKWKNRYKEIDDEMIRRDTNAKKRQYELEDIIANLEVKLREGEQAFMQEREVLTKSFSRDIQDREIESRRALEETRHEIAQQRAKIDVLERALTEMAKRKTARLSDL